MNKANLRVTERYYADREYSFALKILNGRGIELAKKNCCGCKCGCRCKYTESEGSGRTEHH